MKCSFMRMVGLSNSASLVFLQFSKDLREWEQIILKVQDFVEFANEYLKTFVESYNKLSKVYNEPVKDMVSWLYDLECRDGSSYIFCLEKHYDYPVNQGM